MAEAAAFVWTAVKSAALIVKGSIVKWGMAANLSHGTSLAVANFAMQAAGVAALSAASAALMQPKLGARAPGEWVADPNAGIPFAIGDRIGVAGNIVYKNTYGKDNEYKGIVSVLSGAGPIGGYLGFTADRETVSFSSGAATGRYAGSMWIDRKLGDQPDTALTFPTFGSHSLPSWTANHKLSGKACFGWTLRMDSKFSVYPQGEPAPIHVLEGIPGYDHRLDSTFPGGDGPVRLNDRSTWPTITNPIIADLNWVLGLRENGKVVGGCGASPDAIDWEAYTEAANVADLNGWKVCAYPRTTDPKAEVRAALLQAGGALISRRAGLYSVVTRGAVKASVATITVADTAGPIETPTTANVLNRINTLTPRYLSEDHEWTMVPAAPVTSETYVDEDRGATRSDSRDYPYVSSAEQAAQLAALDIAHSREGIAGTIPLKPWCRDIRPGDAFVIDGPGFVADNLKCLCLQRDYDPATDVVRITFVSETDGKIAWALGQEANPPATPALSSVDRGEIAAPDEEAWEAVGGVIGTGVIQPAVIVTGAVDNAYATTVIVEFRKDGDTTWNAWTEAPATTERFELTGFEPDTDYEIAISYRSIFGAISDRLVLGPVTTGGLTAGGIEGPDGPITGDDILKPRPYAADTIRNTFSDLTGLSASNATITATGAGDNSLAFTPTGSNPYLQWVLGRPGDRVHRIRARIRAVGAEITEAMWDGRLTYNITGSNNSTGTGRVATIPYPPGGLPVGEWRDIEWVCDELIDYLDSANIINVRLRPVTGSAGALHFGRIEAGYAGGATANTGALADKDVVDTPDLSDGAVSREKVAIGAITPSRTALGDHSNMLPDPDMADLAAWSGNALNAESNPYGPVTANGPSLNYIRFNGSGTRTLRTARVGANPSTAYLFTGNQWVTGGSGATATTTIEWFNGGGTLLRTDTLSTYSGNSSTAGAHSQVVTSPTTASYYEVVLTRVAGDSTTFANFAALVARRATDSEILAQNAARLGYHVTRENGSTVLTDVDAVTALGPSDGVIGGGALIYKDAVDLATGDVINKTAGNLIYSGGATVESLKPAAAGADPTASNVALAVQDQGLLATQDQVGTGQIDDGAVVKDKIGTGQVSATKLDIGNTENMFPDPLLTDVQIGTADHEWVRTGGSGYSTAGVSSGNGNSNSFSVNRIDLSAGGVAETGGIYTPMMVIEPGDSVVPNHPLYGTALIGAVNQGGQTTNCESRLWICWYSGPGAAADDYMSRSQVGAASTTTYSSLTGPNLRGIVVPPQGATRARYLIERTGSVGTDSTRASGFTLQRAPQLGQQLTLQDGTTVATDALLKTDLGTAAALDGAGTGAYANNLGDLDLAANNKLGGIEAGADVTGVHDARGTRIDYANATTDQPPSWYRANHVTGMVTEQKSRASLGVPGSGTQYGTLKTSVTTISTSYPIVQMFEFVGGVYQRQSTNESTWGAWSMMFDRQNRPTFSASDLYETGTTPATNANYKTILGPSAGVDGAGGLLWLDSVGPAEIDADAVTFAKIAAGDAGQMRAFSNDGNVVLTTINTWYDVAEIEITTRAGEAVRAYGHFAFSGDTDSGTFSVQGRMTLNGDEIGPLTSSNSFAVAGTHYLPGSTIPAGAAGTPGAGTHTYKMQARRTGGTGVVASRRFMDLMTTKDSL